MRRHPSATVSLNCFAFAELMRFQDQSFPGPKPWLFRLWPAVREACALCMSHVYNFLGSDSYASRFGPLVLGCIMPGPQFRAVLLMPLDLLAWLTGQSWLSRLLLVQLTSLSAARKRKRQGERERDALVKRARMFVILKGNYVSFLVVAGLISFVVLHAFLSEHDLQMEGVGLPLTKNILRETPPSFSQ